MANFEISSWYLHFQRVFSIIGAPDFTPSPGDMPQQAIFRSRIQNALLRFINQQKVKPLAELILENKLAPGTLFTHYDRFYCKGITAHHPDRKSKKTPAPAVMYAKLDSIKEQLILTSNFYAEHLTGQSAYDALSGQKRLFLFGSILEVNENQIIAQPFCVADLYLVEGTGIFNKNQYWNNYMELRPEEVDEFSRVKDLELFPSKKDLEILRDIPESAIKQAFREILNEPREQKDWGGETSDLYTNNISVSGKRLTGSFLFKGPAKFHPMTAADLGKNGDQIPRLLSEETDIVVLQHCHEITPFVRTTFRAYATKVSHPRLFLLIDGYETLKILYAYNKLGVREKTKVK